MRLETFIGAISGDLLHRLLDAGAMWLAVWVAGLAAVLAVAACVIDKVRAAPAQQEPDASQMMSKFRELHSQGELSNAEFRTIKTTLATQLQAELNDNGEKGYDE